MTTNVLYQVLDRYEVRRRELVVAERNARSSGRPLMAALYHEAAEVIERAAADELVNPQPPGIGTWEKLP